MNFASVIAWLDPHQKATLAIKAAFTSESGTLHQFAASRRLCPVTGALAPSRPGTRDACSWPQSGPRTRAIIALQNP